MICVEYFLPKQPVEDASEAAKKLRNILVNLVLGHICVIILAVAFVTILTAVF